MKMKFDNICCYVNFVSHTNTYILSLISTSYDNFDFLIIEKYYCRFFEISTPDGTGWKNYFRSNIQNLVYVTLKEPQSSYGSWNSKKVKFWNTLSWMSLRLIYSFWEPMITKLTGGVSWSPSAGVGWSPN